MKKFINLFFYLVVFYCNAQEKNILKNNISLLKSLSKFYYVSEVDSNYIKFQTKKSIDLGYGVAFRDSGKIIYPANDSTSYYIKANGKYIILAKKKNSTKDVFGMIDNSGNIVLNFKYDRIGSVFIQLPDNMITVQVGDKFGIFDTRKNILSDIKYDNSGGWLNDGYSYHEGGASEANDAIYSQLELKKNKKKIIRNDYDNYVVINKENIDKEFLISENGEKISKTYLYINQLYYYRPLYFLGAIDPYHYVLLDDNGKEISKIDRPLPNKNDFYIELDYQNYYFIESKKIVTIPHNYSIFVTCYAESGFLGFRDVKNGSKLFIDKYGNILNENELK